MCFSYIISMTKTPASSVRTPPRPRVRPAAAARPRNVLEEISMKSFRIAVLGRSSVWGGISALHCVVAMALKLPYG